MTIDGFKIYIDRLREGKEETLSESFAPDFLDVKEHDLRFSLPLQIEGKAQVVDNELILRLQVKLSFEKTCARCNQWGKIDLEISDLIIDESCSEIKHGVFDFSDRLREEILLNVPDYWRCSEANCLNLQGLENYLAKDDKKKFEENPFANLNLPGLK